MPQMGYYNSEESMKRRKNIPASAAGILKVGGKRQDIVCRNAVKQAQRAELVYRQAAQPKLIIAVLLLLHSQIFRHLLLRQAAFVAQHSQHFVNFHKQTALFLWILNDNITQTNVCVDFTNNRL